MPLPARPYKKASGTAAEFLTVSRYSNRTFSSPWRVSRREITSTGPISELLCFRTRSTTYEGQGVFFSDGRSSWSSKTVRRATVWPRQRPPSLVEREKVDCRAQRQRRHLHVSRPEAVGGCGERGRFAESRKTSSRRSTTPRSAEGPGGSGGDGAGPTSRPHEHSLPRRWGRVGADSVPAWPRLSTDHGKLSRLHSTDLIGGERPDWHRAKHLNGLRKSWRRVARGL